MCCRNIFVGLGVLVLSPGAGLRGEEVVKAEDWCGEVGCKLPFVAREDCGGEGVVEIEPFVSGVGFREVGVVLERVGWVCREDVGHDAVGVAVGVDELA